MSDEMIMAEGLDRALAAPALALMTGDPEFAAMSALGHEIAGALARPWMTAADRDRIWRAANAEVGTPEPERPVWLRKRSLLAAGGGALALTAAAAIGWTVVHRRHTAAA